jgi:hypothetical protein
MKIISLSSSTAGSACAVATAIKKHFYNNDYLTNIFDYLEISLESINQFLLLDEDDIYHLDFDIENSYTNSDDKTTIKFKYFDKVLSHHDLINNFTEDDILELKNKYVRRYNRLINYINTQDKIFFLRYGNENYHLINSFYQYVMDLNPYLTVYFIHLDYSDNNYNIQDIYANINFENYLYFNFANYISDDIIYNDDLFFKTLQYDWKSLYEDVLKELFNEDEKKENIFFE